MIDNFRYSDQVLSGEFYFVLIRFAQYFDYFWVFQHGDFVHLINLDNDFPDSLPWKYDIKVRSLLTKTIEILFIRIIAKGEGICEFLEGFWGEHFEDLYV
jgi:hypothetical protein